MPARANAPRMQMRFDLERRRPGERRWRRLQGRGLRRLGARAIRTSRASSSPSASRACRCRRPIARSCASAGWPPTAPSSSAPTRAPAPAVSPTCARTSSPAPSARSSTRAARPGVLHARRAQHRPLGGGPFSVTWGPARRGRGLAAGRAADRVGRRAACVAARPIVVRVDADRRIEESEERGNGARRACPLCSDERPDRARTLGRLDGL